MPKLCEFETCRKQASYGNSYGKPIRCKEHKEEFKLVSQLCQEDNCMVFSCYNFKNETKPMYCMEHKKAEMVDIKNKSKNCNYPDCNIRATYNFQNETKGIYCVKHKNDEMIDVYNKKCAYPNCSIQSIFNYDYELTPLYCLKHKKQEMVDVKNKKCQYINCKKQPTFNYEGEVKAIYCSHHKKDKMIDIINKMCQHINCKIHPTFNYEGQHKAIYCVEHKKDNMVNVNSKKCQYLNCKKIPTFNFENKNYELYCSEHKKDGMVDVKHKKCIYENCKIRPTFNYQNENLAIYCFKHKLKNMIDVKHKKCKSEICLGTRGNPKYKGYCSYCYQHLFPNDPLTLQIRCKTKEIAVRDFINLNFEGFQHDKPLWTGNCDCTHRRKIDHRKLFGNTLLCIETDEDQHKGYDKEDEEIRYDDLYMLHGGKIIFIRFNPDKFKDKTGKSVNPMLYTRLPALKEEIKKQITRIKNEENKELLEIIKLYYDEIKN